MRLFLIFSSLFFSMIVNAQVTISLKNTTGNTIKSATIEGVSVGTIEKDSIKTIVRDAIIRVSGLPLINITGYIGNKKIDNSYPFCGTFLKTITKGEFKMDIVLFTEENGNKRLILKN